jgi:hypothetical protein
MCFYENLGRFDAASCLEEEDLTTVLRTLASSNKFRLTGSFFISSQDSEVAKKWNSLDGFNMIDK